MNKFIKDKKKILLILIFILGIFSRTFLWPNTIEGINCDEAMTAINAKAIAETGCDMYGTKMPVYFEAWLGGGQSAFLTYFMALCIKIFGYNIFSIRLPMLIISIISLFVFYKLIKLVFEDDRIALISLAILAINPWHIMQSVWSLDCNMFPHVFLISLYLLVKGVMTKKRILIYVSMVFFGLTTYTYGVALYFIPIFLVIYMLTALKLKEVSMKDLIISAIIVIIIALPLIIMSLINILKLESIEIGPITIPFFKFFQRNYDMIFYSDNILKQLWMNFTFFIARILYSYDKLEWNALKGFGALYTGSIIFAIFGFYYLYKEKILQKNNKYFLICWIFSGFIVGLIINNVNINRLNIIWYPIIILISYGIYNLIGGKKINKKVCLVFCTIFTICYISFSYAFYTKAHYTMENTFTWSRGFCKALNYAKENNDDVIVDRTILYDNKNITFYIYCSDYNFNKNGFLKRDIFINQIDVDNTGNIIRIYDLWENPILNDINNRFTLINVDDEESIDKTCIFSKNKLQEMEIKSTFENFKQFNNYYITER